MADYLKYVVSTDQLREIEWSRSWTWAILFKDAPFPFNNWFPATSIEETIFNIEKLDFNISLSGVSIPKNSNIFEININILDGGSAGRRTNNRSDNTNNPKLVLHNWIRDWGNQIVDTTKGYVQTLESCCRELTIAKFDSKAENCELTSYLVFPYGEYKFNGTSNADVMTNDFTFMVVGKPDATKIG